jgi:Fe-S-cluster containining protein
MARELAMTDDRFVERYVRRVGGRLSLREDASRSSGGRCALLAGANTCTVYAARPAQCRTFPYWPNVLQDPDAFDSARATCPGITPVVPEGIRVRAFARLAELYADAGPAIEPSEGSVHEGVVFLTGLEADYLAEQGGAPLARSEEILRRVREIERDTGYPASYGRSADMMRARAREDGES